MRRITRRDFLKWAMAVAITLHLAPGLARAAPEPPAATEFVPEDCFSTFPICFRLHFVKPKRKYYLPIVQNDQ